MAIFSSYVDTPVPLTGAEETVVEQNGGTYSTTLQKIVQNTPFVGLGTPTVRTNADRWSCFLNVKDYGAKLNGTTDDSNAVALARAAQPANDGVIRIPAGNWYAFVTDTTKSVLWQTLGALDYGTSAPGTNPVTSIGDGDVLETFLGGRKRFSKVCTSSANNYAVVEMDFTWNGTNPNSIGNTLAVIGNQNGSTFSAGGLWPLGVTLNVNGAADDNYAIASTVNINAGGTGSGSTFYGQVLDYLNTTSFTCMELDAYTGGSDPIPNQNPMGGKRSIVVFNVGTQGTGANPQVSRGVSIGSNDPNGKVGCGVHISAPLYYSAFDCSNSVFSDGTVSALRTAPNQVAIDFSSVAGAPSSQNYRTLGYVSGSASLCYKVSGTNVLTASDTGVVVAQTALGIGGTTGPTWTTGNGTPSGTQPVGSIYSNKTGATGTRLYISAGSGVWNAVAGV